MSPLRGSTRFQGREKVSAPDFLHLPCKGRSAIAQQTPGGFSGAADGDRLISSLPESARGDLAASLAKPWRGAPIPAKRKTMEQGGAR